MTHRTATANLDTPYGIEARFDFTFSEYSLSGKTVTFVVCNKNLVELFSIDLTSDCLTVNGQTVELRIPAAEAGYVDLEEDERYQYGLTVGGDYRVQGWWSVWAQSGPVSDQSDTVTVTIDDVTVDISVVGGGVTSLSSLSDLIDSATETAPSDSDEFVFSNGTTACKVLWSTIKSAMASLFVPLTRTVNSKALSSNISLTPADVGAATSAQGATADSATQPGDNVSTLVNDAGYLTGETDPVFSASPAASVSSGDIINLGNLSGTNSGDQDLSGLVPYSGATGDVDLGDNALTAEDFNLDNTTHADQHGLITKNGTPFIHDFNYGDNGTVTTDGKNTFIGINAGNLSMGSTATEAYHSSYNNFIGTYVGQANTTGYYNNFMGYAAGHSNTTGYYNNLMGYVAGYSNTTGYSNNFMGYAAGYSNTTGYGNNFIGSRAGQNNTTGYNNSFIGYEAGRYITGGSDPNETTTYSLFIGNGTKALADGDTNEIVIGYNATGVGDNSVVLGNDSIVKTILKGNVGINTTDPTISDGYGLHIDGKIIRIGTSKTPSSAGDTGNVGEICWDANYLYICVATNTWKRVAISTW